MKIALYPINESCAHGVAVSLVDRTPYLGDELNAGMKALVKKLVAQGHECYTTDQLPPEEVDVFLFQDMPAKDNEALLAAKRLKRKCILIIGENPYILPGNWDRKRYAEFDAVYSYEDLAVKDYGAIKCNYAFNLPRDIQLGESFHERKFAVMVSSRVKKNRPGLISYQRIQTIKFYEKHHPEAFDLYGIGWEKGTKLLQDHPKIFAILHALGRLDDCMPKVKHPSWRGTTNDKCKTVSHYKFAYCSENTLLVPGYVTEKLFEALFSGAVPVYSGNPDSNKQFPEGLFVDKSKFATDAELYDFLAAMTEEEWLGMRKVGHDYLMDPKKTVPFSAETYATILLSGILQ